MKAFLNSITAELSGRLRQCGRSRTYAQDEEVFAGGAEAAFLPIVASGRIKMIHFLEPGKEVIIGIFQTGDMFALPPVFDGGTYPATALAMERSELLLIARSDFIDLLRDSTEFSFAVIAWMSEMLRDKTATIQNLAMASPQHRVGHVLLKLAEREGGGDAPVRITLRRQDIAKMAGVTTETTIRAVRVLAEKGLIAIRHGKIIIETTGPLYRFLEN